MEPDLRQRRPGIQLYPEADYTTIDHNIIDSNGTGIIISGTDGVASSHSNIYDNVLSNATQRHDVESWWPAGSPVGVGNSVDNNCVWGGREGTIDTSGGGFTAQNNIDVNPQYGERLRPELRDEPLERLPDPGGRRASRGQPNDADGPGGHRRRRGRIGYRWRHRGSGHRSGQPRERWVGVDRVHGALGRERGGNAQPPDRAHLLDATGQRTLRAGFAPTSKPSDAKPVSVTSQRRRRPVRASAKRHVKPRAKPAQRPTYPSLRRLP